MPLQKIMHRYNLEKPMNSFLYHTREFWPNSLLKLSASIAFALRNYVK